MGEDALETHWMRRGNFSVWNLVTSPHEMDEGLLSLKRAHTNRCQRTACLDQYGDRHRHSS